MSVFRKKLRKTACRFYLKRITLFLCLGFVLCMGTMQVQASNFKKWGANATDTDTVDTQKPCTLTLKIPTAYRSELADVEIPVRLYHIADIAEDGTCRDRPGYESLELGMLTVHSSAQELKEKAEEAAVFLNVDSWMEADGAEQTPLKYSNTDDPGSRGEDTSAMPDRQFLVKNNKDVQTDMEPGLYLISVKPVQVDGQQYEALPYIIFLPSLLEGEGEDGYPEQIWSTDCVVDLKLARFAAPHGPSVEPEPDIPEKPPEVQPSEPTPDIPETPPEPPSSDPIISNTFKPGETATGDVLHLRTALWCVGLFGGVLIIAGIWGRYHRR